jgi:carbonic anhydrase
LVANNESYSAHFDKGDLPLPPAKVAVVACMDARFDPARVLGLEEGDAHVIRNAGGVVTDDEIRSPAISQRLLGTQEIVLIHHTDRGRLTFSDDDFRRSIQEETGIKPEWAAEAFDASTRTSGSRSAASRRARSSRARTRSAASCTRSRPAASEK